MKLIKQVSLAFRLGTSDKVYEVDLCEVGADQFVVNFRYGRRGATLRDGSKTALPVARAAADKIFDKLVSSKVDKGYQPVDDIGAMSAAPQSPTPASPAPASAPNNNGPYRSAPGQPQGDARSQEVLRRLQAGEAPGGRLARRRGRTEGWPLDRVIWRAGELRLAAAEPVLLDLLRQETRGRPLRRYAIVWALGRCGSVDSLGLLRTLYDSQSERPCTRAIAAEALRVLYHDADRERFIQGLTDTLPKTLRDLARSGPAEDFAVALPAQVNKAGRGAVDLLRMVYLIDNEHVRPGLLHFLAEFQELDRHAPHWLRALFKASEFRGDGRVFGLVAHRYESNWAREGLKARHYMRRRAWRTLRRLGELNDPDWMKMAVGVLLPFTDADAVTPLAREYYSWSGPQRRAFWGPFAPYWAFNQLLYRNSKRFSADTKGRAFRAISATTHQKNPAAREEAFPELWDEAPFGLLHLLDESACEPVHRFAVKALRASTRFCSELEIDVLLMLLSRPYEVTAQLGFELAEGRYDAANPDSALVAAVATCAYEPARRRAQGWIDADRARFCADGELMAALALSPYADNRQFARDLLRSSLLSDEAACALIGRLMAALLELGPDDGERAADVANTLLKGFSRQLTTLGVGIIRDLIAHVLPELHELAGDILLNHAELALCAPDDVLVALLASSSEGVRGIGARLVAQLSDTDLAQRPELLFSLSTDERADLRNAMRAVLGRLASTQPAFAAQLGAMFVEALRRDAKEGVHSHLVSVLRQELAACLPRVDKEEVWRLLHSKTQQAQELGGVLLAANIDPEELTLKEIVRLGSHKILSVREACWSMCERNLERLRRGANQAMRLLDAKWEDTRLFAFTFFRENFNEEQLTPQILVAICDSVRPDVQAFGRELITRYFAEADGHQYLLKLSEHPAEALQLFATNYLERYALGDVTRLVELEPYFVSVLSRVNKARMAKSRILAFLEAEGTKSAEAAEVVARVFTRQSVTMAIGDKERLIAGMLRLRQHYPALALPLTVRAPAIKGRKQNEEAPRGV
ncbi:MAG: hypothetical protein JRH20_02345 [Deltaproteobacteria bacterium]|nr:hypothetical protein [Deltaproteobacteria bacterium]